MNLSSHLAYTCAEFEQEPDERGVSPISNQDGQIISSIINILSSKGEHQLASILNRWKDVSDNDIVQSLHNYTEGIIEESIDGNADNPYLIPYINIEGNILQANHIYSITKQDEFDNDTNRNVFNIIINKSPLPAKNQWYMDMVIPCNSDQYREKVIQTLKSKLLLTYLCKFI